MRAVRGMFAIGLAGVWIAGLTSPSAQAQTQLPGIVVTSPSPVVRPRDAAEPQTEVEAPAFGEAQAPPGMIIVEDAFVPITVATEHEILATQGPTITDTLQTKPGIIGSTFAAGANRPIIRGLDSYRVRTQENGIGTHDVAALSEDHAIPVDPFAADRVEVVRGPATLRYGSQAIAGVVSVENNRIPSFVPPRGFTAEMKGGLSSVDDGRDGAFAVTAGSGNFVVHADAFRRRAEDYDTPHGTQANSFVESDGFALGTSYVWSRGFIGVAFTRFNSLYGIPGAEALEERPRIDMQQDKIMSKGEWRVRDFGIEAIRAWFGSTDYAHNEVIDDGGTDIVGTRFTNKEVEGRVEVQHLPITTGLGEWRGAAGVQLGRRKVAGVAVDEPVDGLIDPARTRSVAAFLFEELQVSRLLRLQAAVRIEHTSVDGTGLADFSDPLNPILFSGERTFEPFSASLGMLYELPLGVVARLTAQHVERSPEAGELFSKGVHEATGTFEIGNPFLEKEKANTIELGFKRAQGPFRFDTSAYYTQFEGFIFKNRTNVFCNDTLASCGAPGSDELQQVLFEQRDANFYGVEVAAQYDVASIWRGVWGIDGQYDFVRTSFAGDGNVPRIPPHRLGAGIYYRDASWFARVAALHAFRQDEIGEFETETSGYTLVNAELSYTFRMTEHGGVVPEWTIGLRGDNLLDDDVRNHVSFKKDEVLLPGRSVRLFGSIKLN